MGSNDSLTKEISERDNSNTILKNDLNLIDAKSKG